MRKFWLYFTIATLIGVVFLWLTARELPWGDVDAWAATVDASHLVVWSLIYIVTYSLCHAARIIRWNELVRPLGDVDARLVHRVCVVGFTAILLLPFRLGEFVRPYLLARRTPLQMSAVLGTVVVERVVDGLVVTGLLFVTLATYSGTASPAFANTAGIISAAIFVPALVVCLFALWMREPTVRTLRRVGYVVSEKLTDRVLGLLEAFIEGFRGLIEGRALARFLSATSVYWAANVVSMWLLARYGFGFDVSVWDTTTIMAVMVIGLMIPAGPAMTGNFEFFALKSLALFVATEGVAGVQAGAFAALLHILQFVVIATPGFIVMWLDPDTRHLIAMSEAAASENESEGQNS